MHSLLAPLLGIFLGLLGLRVALTRARKAPAGRQRRMEAYRRSPESHILHLD